MPVAFQRRLSCRRHAAIFLSHSCFFSVYARRLSRSYSLRHFRLLILILPHFIFFHEKMNYFDYSASFIDYHCAVRDYFLRFDDTFIIYYHSPDFLHRFLSNRLRPQPAARFQPGRQRLLRFRLSCRRFCPRRPVWRFTPPLKPPPSFAAF